ncbi:TPA: transcriptional regulator NrdR [Patescibacteria group bacterium]|uniref:Transcriptional repressor NrdR n=2 Tax=Bacteria division Kazan-3B-28 TaxID=1798534 RepID=A0A0G1X7V9_UNCK3|nr:MAG: transcriptional regulator NrdR, transcriptional repressor NrdR [candidate division Kazan bacterium GW2011_GWA1_50_15]KKW25610.1 MAG: Transcriptional repressor NrdR [candidate division Kazan bacterium GW2011_GWC1_52_13]KKW26915.1 MAG: Transcriptional repressor NrdR [candidate division Kazan bacterium GW2011_GWB1_52_7]HAV66094.1 transcriptional regulator NrdR [Patescibacteria group bacterium]HCL47625.1 transcriptional regulator NrdR [Patescibacteria group bacterium]
MKCPQCNHEESAVVDSREAEEGGTIRRRRECVKCKFRFTTYERLEHPRLMVIKKDGSRELFDRGKIAGGIYKAFYKRPVAASAIEKMLDEIEREVYEANRDEIASGEVGELVMRHIERLDQVAYIRFAAVYREFADLDTFKTEIQKLITKSHNQGRISTK